MTIMNIYAQYSYGNNGSRYTDYLAFIKSLSQALCLCNSDAALPYNIGCVRGGADWNKIYQVIELCAIDFSYDIYLYRKDMK